MATPTRWLSVKEYAQEKGVHVETVKRWIKAGTVDAQRIGDHGHWRVRIAPDPVFETVTVDPCCGVYFVAMGEFIKIGISQDVYARWAVQRTDAPYDFTPLGFLPQDTIVLARAVERTLHEQFRSLWYRGEWFRDTPALRSFIARHARPWPKHRSRVAQIEARCAMPPSQEVGTSSPS